MTSPGVNRSTFTRHGPASGSPGHHGREVAVRQANRGNSSLLQSHPLTTAQMCSILLFVMSKPTRPKTPGQARRRRPLHLGADRQVAILDFISGSLRDRGYPPTIREIGTALGIASTNGVRYYLDRLEQSGKIRRDRWTSRGIELQTAEPAET